MPTKTLTITQLYIPPNITTPITASLYYRQFYAANWILIDANVSINLDGTITGSPIPQITIDPSQKYQLRAVNQNCGYEYIQNVIISAYCPIGYTLAPDGSYCFQQTITSATPPTNPQNSVSVTLASDYTIWGSLIYNSGYNINGTGTFTQIPYTNTFWVNGSGYPAATGTGSGLGPLNRSGLWTSVALSNQTIGFSVCINAPNDGVYYVGMAADNYSSIYLDGVAVVQMDANAMGVYLNAHGYAGASVNSTFRFWHIYPVMITAGNHVLEIIGTNVSSAAALGCEVYNNTSAQIQSATSYTGTGLNLIFSSKDYIGSPIQNGNFGIGYQCPTGYALAYCDSPIICVKTITVPVEY